MSPDQSFVRQVLREHGLSLTRPRLMLIRVLWEKKPQTMRQITEKIDEHMDRVTVYRTIQVLEKAGLLQRVSLGWKYQIELAGPFSHHHHHLTCLKCRQVVAISDHRAENLLDKLAREHNFLATQHQLEIQGYCGKCQNKVESRKEIVD
jgi:Fur family ferric uptake transcriptional regulator